VLTANVFTLEVAAIEGIATFTEEADFINVLTSKSPVPCLLKAGERVRDFLNGSRTSDILQRFSGQYLQTSGVKMEGRTQASLTVGSGLQEAEQLFQTFLPPLVDVTGVKSATNFHATSWLWGSAPNADWVGMTPNYSAVLRIVAQGEILQVTVQYAKFKEQLEKTKAVPVINLDTTIDFLKQLTSETAAEYKKQKVGVQSCIQQKGDLLFIPAGWATCERTINHPLHYGLRKSFLPADADTVMAYQTIIDALSTLPGRSVAVYNELLEKLRGSTPTGCAAASEKQ
jgi:hypothetical protein